MAGIRKRTWKTKSGQVSSCYEITYYVNGKLVRKSGFKTKLDAQNALPKITKSYSKNFTVKQLLNIYINEACPLRCKETTIELYKSYIHNFETMHNIQAKKIKPSDINKLKLEWFNRGLKNKSINSMLGFLKTAYNYAIDNNWITENPLRKIDKLPTKSSPRFLIETEMEYFILLAKQYPIDKATALILALYTGIRISELLAIEWNDIDFKNKTLQINKQYYKRILTSTKTNNSNRIVMLHELVIEQLKEYKNSLKVVYPQIFRGKNGYWDRAKFISNYFKPIMEELNHSDFTFHCLRHTYASFLIRHGIPIKFVSEQLGHSDITTTMKIYEHIMPSIREKAMQIFDKIGKCEQIVSIDDDSIATMQPYQ